MKRGKVNKSISHGCFFSRSDFWQVKISQLCFYLIPEERCLISDKLRFSACSALNFSYSGFWALVVGFARNSLQDFKLWILQTSNEDLQYVYKKVLPKAEKDWKKDVKSKSLEDELRAEMSKNAAVRIKRRLSRARSNSLSVARSVETKPAKEVLFPTSPPQDQTRFPLPVAAGREVTSLTGLRPTVSMVGYTAAFRCFCCFAGISNMYKHCK